MSYIANAVFVITTDNKFETAEEISDELGDGYRVIEDRRKDKVVVERLMDEDDGVSGWTRIGTEVEHPDIFAATGGMVEQSDDSDLRVIFDYTNDVMQLERFVE